MQTRFNRRVAMKSIVIGAILCIGMVSLSQTSVDPQTDLVDDMRDLVQKDVAKDIDDGIDRLADWTEIDPKTIAGLLSQIPASGQESVSKQQQDELLGILSRNLVAYKQGDGPAILADLTRAPYTIRTDATQAHRAIFDRHIKTADEIAPEAPDQLLSLLVSRFYKGVNGSGFRDLFNRISPSGSRIEYAVNTAMPGTMEEHLALLMNTGARKSRNGFVALHPSLNYNNAPDRVLRETGSLHCADVWLAATDSDNNKYSRFRRYYWSPKDQTWLPMEMLSMYTRQRKADPFF